MDNEKAIEILRKGYPDINRYAASELETYEYDVETYDEAVCYAISHLEADRWIPVSERLPEPLTEVLVTSTNGYVYTSRIVHGEFEYGGNVIAWKPLPEPYKKSEADE